MDAETPQGASFVISRRLHMPIQSTTSVPQLLPNPIQLWQYLLQEGDVGGEVGLELVVLHGVAPVLDHHGLSPELLNLGLGLCQDLHIRQVAVRGLVRTANS